ncbi:hypothetical protein T02_538 [Trichinella nativa]|uniref:Uncharacterized protein n=1 Tax=Trichinella nativa TaxID=6335 RepID=A0A0V1KTP8_9BILA|nr:hypothetical protein T02_538 [Trichinella nativa]
MEKFFINSQRNTNVNDENSAQLHHSRMLLHVKSRQLVLPAIQNESESRKNPESGPDRVLKEQQTMQ